MSLVCKSIRNIHPNDRRYNTTWFSRNKSKQNIRTLPTKNRSNMRKTKSITSCLLKRYSSLIYPHSTRCHNRYTTSDMIQGKGTIEWDDTCTQQSISIEINRIKSTNKKSPCGVLILYVKYLVVKRKKVIIRLHANNHLTYFYQKDLRRQSN